MAASTSVENKNSYWYLSSISESFYIYRDYYKLPVSHSLPNSLAIPTPIHTLLSTSFVSSGRIMFGSGYENCPEFGSLQVHPSPRLRVILVCVTGLCVVYLSTIILDF